MGPRAGDCRCVWGRGGGHCRPSLCPGHDDPHVVPGRVPAHGGRRHGLPLPRHALQPLPLRMGTVHRRPRQPDPDLRVPGGRAAPRRGPHGPRPYAFRDRVGRRVRESVAERVGMSGGVGSLRRSLYRGTAGHPQHQTTRCRVPVYPPPPSPRVQRPPPFGPYFVRTDLNVQAPNPVAHELGTEPRLQRTLLFRRYFWRPLLFAGRGGKRRGAAGNPLRTKPVLALAGTIRPVVHTEGGAFRRGSFG